MLKILWHALVYMSVLIALTPLLMVTVFMIKVWWDMSKWIWFLW